ncbi:MAG TPA: hypothetical protein VK306_11520 [Acidimicrobiales bacterium]|nr:hypothetical protein [Acidimicrobiales bacterium]
MVTADPDADLENALVSWRRQRRRRRVADVHPIDALYQAYVSALLGAAALYLAAAAVGDSRLDAADMHLVATHGADWVGAVAAGVLAIGLRSGSRGGPLALEGADVRHVLLAPVDRTTALRGPALRQLRFFVFVAIVSGAAAGLLASQRLEHHAAAWMACGALAGLAIVLLAYGAALVASALRLPSPVATLVGVALVAYAVADGLDAVEGSPLTPWGSIALWPYGFDVAGVVALGASFALVVVGLLRIGDQSLEAAERRATLVGQLRFAATLQDLRTVMVLRRQLAMELPRLRPWVTLRVRGTGRLPVWTRGWRGVLRWPAARVGRLVLLAAVAGLALRGAWEGTTPLVVVAGLALYLAGLDALEPLAQEVDHPSRAQSAPVTRGDLHLRHLPVGAAVMLAVCVLAGVAGLVVGPSLAGLAVAAMCVVPAAVGAAAGAAVSVVGGGPDVSGEGAWSLVPPEVAGIRLMFRTGLPPALAVVGTLPLLAGRAAVEDGRTAAQAAGAAASGAVAIVVLGAVVAAWVRHRDRLHEAWQSAMDQAMPSRTPSRSLDEETAHVA